MLGHMLSRLHSELILDYKIHINSRNKKYNRTSKCIFVRLVLCFVPLVLPYLVLPVSCPCLVPIMLICSSCVLVIT